MDASLPGRSSVGTYQYSPLPSVRHIRLLQIQARSASLAPTPFFNDDDPVRISLKVVHIDDQTKYDALSYTWGNPITVYQNENDATEQMKIFEQVCKILCDGAPMMVTRNLYDALLAIRRIPSQGSYKLAHGSDRTTCLWVDSICINQQDLRERNTQVNLMGQIYTRAQMTIVWLGRDDVYTRTAGKIISLVNELTQDQARSVRAAPPGSNNKDPGTQACSQVSDADWLAVYAWLNRSWFMRVWTVQEVALAARSIVLCGMVLMSWSQLVSVCQTLDRSRLYDHVESLAAEYMKHGLKESSDHGDEASKQLRIYQTQAPCHFYPPLAVTSIAHVRAGMGIRDTYLTYRPNVKVVDLTESMALFRSSFTSEPRDRVYGFLGLISHNKIVPDYGKPIEKVYLDAICYHLETSKNLDFLGDIQDPSRTSLPYIPSWVPDYSAEMLPQRFSQLPGLASQYCAAGASQFCYKLLSQPTPTLQLQGYILGSVEDIATFKINDDLTEIVELLWGLPHLYKADVSHRADEITSGRQGGVFNLKVEGGYLQGVEVNKGQYLPLGVTSKCLLNFLSTETHSSGASTGEREVELLPVAASIVSWLANARLQTHIEVLWRTLIADTWEGQHPAPIDAGFAFADCLIARLQYTCLKMIHSTAVDTNVHDPVSINSTQLESEIGDNAGAEQLFNSFNLFAQSEFEGFTRVEDVRLVEEGFPIKTLSSVDPLIEGQSSERVSRMLTRFLPIFESISDVLAHNVSLENIRLWTRRFGQTMPGRKLFLTHPYPFLGSGPESLDEECSVCILAGGNVPYLIKKVSGQDDNRYTFIGEAYVHGMMHGEAEYLMAENGEGLTEIHLV
jgi:hypothetical protein